MKKLLLTGLLILTFGIYQANAQADSDLVQWGVKAGVNFANLSGDDVGSTDARTGFNVGLVAEVPFTERFSIQPELYYSTQGAETKMNILGNTIKSKLHLDYIHIAPVFKYYLLKGLNVHVGPQLGFNINNEVKLEGAGGSSSESNMDDINDIDFDIVAGVGYKFDLGVFVNARYMYGISKVSKDNDVHNSVFQIGVGYMF